MDRKPVKISFNATKKIFLAKGLYDELGTLKKVAWRMELSPERIRQLLFMGNAHGLIVHPAPRKFKAPTEESRKRCR